MHRSDRPDWSGRQEMDGQRAFVVLCLIQVMLISAITLVTPALPVLARQFDLGATAMVLVSAGYGLAFSGGLLAGGRLADEHGPRRTLTTGLMVFLGGSLVGALAVGFPMLLASRLVQGVGAAAAAPAAMALLGAVFPDANRRSAALATWGAMAGLGATAGLLVAGPLSSWVSWRWVFLIPAGAAALVLPAVFRLPPGVRGRRVPWRPWSIVVLTLGLVGFTTSLLHASEFGPAPHAIAGLVVALALLVLFAHRDRRSAAPLLPLTLVRSPDRLTALLAALLASAGQATLAFFLILYLQGQTGLSAAATSAALVPFALTLLLAAHNAPGVVQRRGARTAMVAGLGMGAAGLLAASVAMVPGLGVAPASRELLLVVTSLLFAVGVAWLYAGATVAAVAGVEPDDAGGAAAVVNLAVELGPTVGLSALVAIASAVTTHLAGSGHAPETATPEGYAAGLAAGACLFAAAAAWIVTLGRRRPDTAGAPLPASASEPARTPCSPTPSIITTGEHNEPIP